VKADTVASCFAPEGIGKTVRLRGWVLRSRSSGGIAFLVLRDRTGSVQVTAKRDAIGAEAFDRVEHLPVESALSLEGTVAADARAQGGREVRASRIEVGHVSEPFPIWTDQTEEFRLDHRHLTVRTQEMVAMVRLKAAMLRSFRDFFDREEVLETTPPILTASSAEGGSEVFALDYFGRPGYLGQSAQLYLEALIAPHERVYALTSSFRAEKSRTPRHLTEYLHLEAELAWCNLEELREFVERMVREVLAELARRAPEELRQLGREPSELANLPSPFPRMTYAEALERLRGQGFDLAWGADIATAEERALTLTERVPLFLTHFPRELKAFYMLQSREDPRTVEAFDLLAPEGYGELVGASCRETDAERLEERIVATGGKLEDYGWYLDLRRYGSVPHAGFGLGIERLLRWVARREHIRDTTPFPRTPARLSP
jgi:asparaginyl-tRNA synthetase